MLFFGVGIDAFDLLFTLFVYFFDFMIMTLVLSYIQVILPDMTLNHLLVILSLYAFADHWTLAQKEGVEAYWRYPSFVVVR